MAMKSINTWKHHVITLIVYSLMKIKKKNSQILSNKIVNIYYIEEVKNSCVSSYSPSLSTIS